MGVVMQVSTEKLPFGRMLAVFTGVLVAANLALAAIGYVFPDLPIPSSMGIVVAMVAAMSAGQSATKAINRRLVFREKAVFAVLATAVSTVLGVGMLWAFFAYFGVPFTLESVIMIMTGDAVPGDEIRQILTWVIPIVLVLYLLVTYFGAALGSRNQIKLQEKLAAGGR
jgi:hypothetical protein